jgi:hypothetical protein
VLRKISGPMRQEVTGYKKKSHKDRLHNLYSAPNIIQVIKSKQMRWVGHIYTHRREQRSRNEPGWAT